MHAALRKWRMWARGEEGSVTLEASMVFPWVLIMTFLLILFSVVLTERVLIYYSASVTAERAAFVWSNSAKDLRTGAYPSGSYDGLYWRLSDDSLLAGVLGWWVDEDGVQVPIEPKVGNKEGASPQSKLSSAGGSMPSYMRGTIRYRNQVWKRGITLETADARTPDALRRFRRTAAASDINVSAVVVEPAEMIRMFDLIRYYKAKMKGNGDGAADYRSKAAAVLERRR